MLSDTACVRIGARRGDGVLHTGQMLPYSVKIFLEGRTLHMGCFCC
jgi:hypothetical protein